MKKIIEGNFEAALYQLIGNIVDLKEGKSDKTLSQILYEWDKTRGNDWVAQTLYSIQKKEINKLSELKQKYE